MDPSKSSAVQGVVSARHYSRNAVSMVADLLPLGDALCVLLAAVLAVMLYTLGTHAEGTSFIGEVPRAACAAALLAALLLSSRHDRALAENRQFAALARSYALRLLIVIAVVVGIGDASASLQVLPPRWLLLWLGSAMLLTAGLRLLLLAGLHRLVRRGALSETIAVVGAGPAADQLIAQLRAQHGMHVAIVGVFDDRVARGDDNAHQRTGTVADLIELGKSGTMDWILLTLPESAQPRVDTLLLRLKALATPIGLCAPGLDAELRALRSGTSAQRGDSRRDALLADIETLLPHWLLTLIGLPLRLLGTLWQTPDHRHAQAEQPSLRCTLDDYDLAQFTAVAAGFGEQHYGYVVTPNADHLIRLHHDPSFRALYDDAAYVLLDSRFIARMQQLRRGQRLPVCTGSDLTATLFDTVIAADDRLVLIGATPMQAQQLGTRYGLTQLAHFNPPMGFIRDPLAVEACLQFVEAHSPFRYCLLAIGAPQQELIAQRLKLRNRARGLALCIGASINFLTGDERRAPQWMQRSGIEWLFRLLSAPRRLAGRYLIRGPQLFGLLRRTEIVLRSAAQA